VSEGCVIRGQVEHSVLFYGVHIAEGAVVRDSVVMPYARIETGAVVTRAIVAEQAVVTKTQTADANGLYVSDNGTVAGIQVYQGDLHANASA
jgi:glucose-1-phosphate adenylyltransferase